MWKDNHDLAGKQMVKAVITKTIHSGVDINQIKVEVGDENSALSNTENDDEDEDEDENNSDETPASSQEDSADEEENSEDDEEEGANSSDVDPVSSEDESNELRYTLVGECYAGFIRLLEEQIEFAETITQTKMKKRNNKSNFNVEDLKNPEKQKEIITEPTLHIVSLKIWNAGVHIGEVSADIKLFNMPFIRQMQIGVLTENGIAFSSVRSGDAEHGFFESAKRNLPQQMINIVNNFEVIKKRDTIKHGTRRVKLKEAKARLEEIVDDLKQSNKTTALIYDYRNKKAAIKAQEILVTMGLHFIQFVDVAEYDIKGLYYETLNLIFHRGELDLPQIGFTNVSDNNLNKKAQHELKEVGVKYQLFLYNSLNY